MGKLTGNKQIGAHAIVDGGSLFQTDEIEDREIVQLKDDDLIEINNKEFSGCNISSLGNFMNFRNIVNYEYNVTAI